MASRVSVQQNGNARDRHGVPSLSRAKPSTDAFSASQYITDPLSIPLPAPSSGESSDAPTPTTHLPLSSAPDEDPQGLPSGHTDVERGLGFAYRRTASAAAAEKKDEGNKPFHERMADDAAPIFGCLVGLAFLLLLKVPTAEFPPALLCAYCYFALLDLLTGIYICYLHIAKARCRDVGRLQAAAAAIGLGAAAVDGLILSFLFLKAELFCVLALALLTSVVGFWGVAAALGCRV